MSHGRRELGIAASVRQTRGRPWPAQAASRPQATNAFTPGAWRATWQLGIVRPMSRMVQDLSEFAAAPDATTGRISSMASGLVGSEILKIAAEIRELVASGVAVCNLTVGDFDPKQFPIPKLLSDGISDALAAGQTNYPPSNGMPELREAVRDYYARELGLGYPTDSILIAGGARPCIYATYRAVVDPGDTVAYPVPSWNNNHYCHMVGATERARSTCGLETSFLPTRDARARELADGAAAVPQLAAQPDRHRVRPRRAARDLRGDRRGEPSRESGSASARCT